MRKGLLVGLMLALMLITALPVFAVLSCIATDTCLILSNEGANRWGDWVAIETTLEPGLFTGATAVTTYNTLGWYANGYTPSPFQFIGVRYVFEEPTCVEDYQINIESLGVVETQILLAVRRGDTWSIVFQDYDYPATTFSWEGAVGGEPVDEIQIQHYGDDPAIRLVAFTGGGDDCAPPPEYPDWYRPFTEDDEAEDHPLYDLNPIRTLAQLSSAPEFAVWSVMVNGGPDTVHAWSNQAGAPVHAAQGGQVISVKPLAWDDCGMGFWSAATISSPEPEYVPFAAERNQPCLVQLYNTSVIGTIAEFPDWPGYSNVNSVYKEMFYLDATNVYIVTIRLDDGVTRLSYLVRNALNYVVVGDIILEGCVLGESVPLTSLPAVAMNFSGVSATVGVITAFSGGTLAWAAVAGAATLTFLNWALPPPPPAQTDMGYTVITMYDEEDAILPLQQNLSLFPTSSDRCNTTGDYRNCLSFNPSFSNAGDTWIASGAVQWTEPGVIINSSDVVYTTINLDADGDYTVSVLAQSLNGLESEIRVFLGSNSERVAAPTEWSYVELATSPVGSPDAGLFYTVGIQNVGSNPIHVKSLCVTDGAEGSPDYGPEACYFRNQSFISGTSEWTVSEDVEWDGEQSLMVPDLETFSQNVQLFPKASGPAVYQLRVYANWWYTGTIDAIATANLAYEWPSGTGYVNMVPQLVSGGLGYGLGTILFTAEIEVEEATNALMNFRVDTTDAGSMGLQGLIIGDACLSPKGGGSFPGQGGLGPPPTINPSCFYIARPRNNDPAAWLQWHWLNTEKVLKCELMVLLGRMEKTMVNAYTLFGWQARYMQSTLRVYSSWAGEQLFPWLSGHFRNIAIGQVTTIYQSGGQCSDLFCLLNNLITGVLEPVNNIINFVLAFLTATADLLFTVITGVIGLALAFATRLFAFVGTATNLFTTIITAYNSATPATIPQLPQCSTDLDSSLLCPFFWMLDNTIFEGRWGLLVTIGMAILTIHVILWAIEKLRDVVVKTGGAA